MLNSIKTFTRQKVFISVLKYLDITFGAVKTVFQSDVGPNQRQGSMFLGSRKKEKK